MTTDVLVLGSGPAGLAVARALSARGLSTVVVAPDPRARWGATYGSWSDQLPDDLSVARKATYPYATVAFGPDPSSLPRAYTRLDTGRLQELLLERAIAAGATVEHGRGEHVEHDAAGTVVAGRRCAVVVDATGSGAALSPRPAATLFQTAWGVVADADPPADGLRWMDFSHRFGDGAEPPTFLYAMPYPDGRAFYEETSLAHEGVVPFELLERRLRERLAASGVALRRVHEVERCVIPLDRPVPDPQRVVGFGAAASLVHPATGFSLARSLALADPLADAIVAGLSAGGPAEASSRAWSALWPADRRRRWRLYAWGARRVARLGADDTRSFFAAFFRGERWGEWLDDRLSSFAVAREMMAHFARLPPGLRWRLLRSYQTHEFALEAG